MFTLDQIEKYIKLHRRSLDQSSSDNERATARRVCAKMRANIPGIHEAASDWVIRQETPPEDTPKPRAAREQQRQSSPPMQHEQPGQPGPNWRANLRDWFTDTVSQVARGLSQADRIDRDVETDIRVGPDSIVVVTTIPLDAALDAARESGGSLQEYARLVGLQIGRDLSDVFEENGY